MADNVVTTVFDADTSDLEAALRSISSVAASAGKAAGDAAKPASALFREMERSSDSAVKGILKGTETWRAALQNVINDMMIKLAQLATNDLLNTIRVQAQKLLVTQNANAAAVTSNTLKNTAITTGDESATKSGSLFNASKVIKQIESDAAAIYAGVFAFFSPVMGPFAAVPAAASAATVAGMEGLVSLDVGAWNVPQNMPAFLHAGEMVVPQNFASDLRDGGGVGGGDSYVINISAIDTQTGAQFLKNNASIIAQTLSVQARHFNRNVPTWKT
jgi:hypothetical protein